MIGTTEKNLRELITSGFIIGFDSGICLVRHWKVNNNLKKDRYTETLHESERRQVHLENKIYEMGPGTEHSTDELDLRSTATTRKQSFRVLLKIFL